MTPQRLDQMAADACTHPACGQPSGACSGSSCMLFTRLHRVPPPDLRQKPAPALRTGCSGARGSCISHPDCPDTNCEGHPDNAPEPGDVDPALRAHFWRLYLIFAAACCTALVLALV